MFGRNQGGTPPLPGVSPTLSPATPFNSQPAPAGPSGGPPQNPATPTGGSSFAAPQSPITSASVNTRGDAPSVIGNDLTIIGQAITIVSQDHVRIDGKVHGNVHGRVVSIGPTGEVTGMVHAETVDVRGQVQGAIRGLNVILHSTARVEGDIHHKTLAISEGAEFDGRVRRPKDHTELQPVLDAASISTGGPARADLPRSSEATPGAPPMNAQSVPSEAAAE